MSQINFTNGEKLRIGGWQSAGFAFRNKCSSSWRSAASHVKGAANDLFNDWNPPPLDHEARATPHSFCLHEATAASLLFNFQSLKLPILSTCLVVYVVGRR
jgi:hypothetical protein